MFWHFHVGRKWTRLCWAPAPSPQLTLSQVFSLTITIPWDVSNVFSTEFRSLQGTPGNKEIVPALRTTEHKCMTSKHGQAINSDSLEIKRKPKHFWQYKSFKRDVLSKVTELMSDSQDLDPVFFHCTLTLKFHISHTMVVIKSEK